MLNTVSRESRLYFTHKPQCALAFVRERSTKIIAKLLSLRVFFYAKKEIKQTLTARPPANTIRPTFCSTLFTFLLTLVLQKIVYPVCVPYNFLSSRFQKKSVMT